MTELRDFELDLIREFKPPPDYIMERRYRGTSKSRIGLFVRDHLQDVGEDWVHHMWERWRYVCDVAHTMGVMMRKNTYMSFAQLIYYMSKVGLLEEVDKPEEERYGGKWASKDFLKTYYRIAPYINREDERWYRPMAFAYPTSSIVWGDLPWEKKEQYYLNRKLARRIKAAKRLRIPLESLPEDLRTLGLKRKRLKLKAEAEFE